MDINTIVDPNLEVDLPEVITPNGDGMNDRFDLSSYGVTKLEIFNRYGNLVYSKTNYVDEWVGQTNDGEELPVGTYFYTMEFEIFIITVDHVLVIQIQIRVNYL